MPQVKSISTSELVFELDESDVEEASNWNYDNPFDDPIAVALKKIGHYSTVYVGWLYIAAFKGSIQHKYKVINWEEVKDYLQRWEKGGPSSPLTITLFFEEETRKRRSIPRKRKIDYSFKGELLG